MSPMAHKAFTQEFLKNIENAQAVRSEETRVAVVRLSKLKNVGR